MFHFLWNIKHGTLSACFMLYVKGINSFATSFLRKLFGNDDVFSDPYLGFEVNNTVPVIISPYW